MSSNPSRFSSVADAASRLRLSERRVRALLETDQLVGQRIGRSWVVDRAGVEHRAAQSNERGRPFSAKSAWAILRSLDADVRLPPLNRSERARARARADRIRLVGAKPGALSSRADVLRLRAHPGVLERLSADRRLVLGGVSAASAHRADLISVDELDAYVPAGEVGRLVDDYALRPGGDADANVRLRVPPSGLWPFAPDLRSVPAAVCALDLIDDGDERSIRAGHALLARVASPQ